jgi:hypothetical protein
MEYGEKALTIISLEEELAIVNLHDMPSEIDSRHEHGSAFDIH